MTADELRKLAEDTVHRGWLNVLVPTADLLALLTRAEEAEAACVEPQTALQRVADDDDANDGCAHADAAKAALAEAVDGDGYTMGMGIGPTPLHAAVALLAASIGVEIVGAQDGP